MNKLKLVLKKNGLILILLILFLYYLVIAYNLKLNGSPDELLRYKIPLYIYNHGTLPIGTDKAVMLPFGNYSYAYYPQLLGGILSAFFMKVMALFSVRSSLLVFAARWTSVVMGIVTVYCVGKSCRLLTKNNYLSCVMAIIVGLLPQFVYLTAYVNNDIIAIAGVSIIIYALLLATKNIWNYKFAIFLTIGIIICLLGYLNSVPFILFGICYAFFILVVQIKDKKITINFGVKIVVVAITIVLICALPLYVRNYYLYHDFTGAGAFSDAYQRWLNEGGQPTMVPYHGNLRDMIFNSDWIVTTFKSSVCLFGYMNVIPKTIYYIFYLLFFYTGLFLNGALLNINKDNKSKKLNVVFNFLMFMGLILTIFLSMYRSVTTDYQPQGRYVLTILPIIAIWWIEGIVKLEEISNLKIRVSIYIAVVIYVIVSVVCILHYVLFNSMIIG